MKDDDTLGAATRVVQAGRRKEWTTGIVSPPVWRASTILYESIADLRASAGRDTHHRLYYGRRGTPTQWSLADALTSFARFVRRVRVWAVSVNFDSEIAPRVYVSSGSARRRASARRDRS